MRQVACPVALHPDGVPLRVPVFAHPAAGLHLVYGEVREGERPEAAAARALFERAGLETRAALSLGASEAIEDGAVWHFALCRVAPPVPARWQHVSADDVGRALAFEWAALDAETQAMATVCQRAFAWMRQAF